MKSAGRLLVLFLNVRGSQRGKSRASERDTSGRSNKNPHIGADRVVLCNELLLEIA